MKYVFLTLMVLGFVCVSNFLGATFSDDTVLLAVAIVCAGGLAGGD